MKNKLCYIQHKGLLFIYFLNSKLDPVLMIFLLENTNPGFKNVSLS